MYTKWKYGLRPSYNLYKNLPNLYTPNYKNFTFWELQILI